MHLAQPVRNQATPSSDSPVPSVASIVATESNAVDRWLALKQRYAFVRGATRGRNGKLVPRTTHVDVKQLAALWSRELARVSPLDQDDRSEHARWRRCVETIARTSRGRAPGAIYERNEELWQDCSKRLAIYLESRKVVPSRWNLAVAALDETLDELPDKLAGIPAALRRAAKAGGALLERPVTLALVALGAVVVLPPIIRELTR